MSVRDAYGQIVASAKIARIKRSLEVQEKKAGMCSSKMCGIVQKKYVIN